MERLTGDARVPDPLRGGVVAIGNFDGFHRGHQAVVGHAVARARAERRPAIVATFDPHPARFFRPAAPPFLLSTIAQRLRWFAAAGADATYVIRFDAALAAIPAEAFVADFLVGRLGAAVAVTGEDFTFGYARAGDTAALAALGAQHGMAAQAVPAVADAGGTISSTRVRRALAEADPQEAARLLTRPFAIEAVVGRGKQVGRTLGSPTANLLLGDYVRPAYGVYAIRGGPADRPHLDGVANLGIRPMILPPVELLEPYFLDYAGNLYDRMVTVELVAFLRPEWTLPDMAALEAQIVLDVADARAVLAASPPAL